MCIISSNMELVGYTSRLRETCTRKRKWDVIIACNCIRLIGYWFGIYYIISELLIELLSSCIGKYTRKECYISCYILAYYNRFLSSSKICLKESIPIITKFLIRTTHSNPIKSKSIILKRGWINNNIIRWAEIHMKIANNFKLVIHNDGSNLNYSMLKRVEPSHLKIQYKICSLFRLIFH